MPINWDDIRYRADAADVKELLETYRVEAYLDTFEARQRTRPAGMREQLLTHGIRLSDRLSPRIFGLFEQVKQTLELAGQVEVFVLPNQEVNAFACVEEKEVSRFFLIGVTAGALEKLDDTEIKSILGHEVGHFLFGNNRMNALISTDENNPAATVLPMLGESLFLRWRKKTEISADRVGLLASGSFHASARSLLKATFGLTGANLNLDIEALLQQVDEVRGKPELISTAFASHPLLPIRLKALELFASSEKARRNGFAFEGPARPDDRLEDEIDELLLLTRRYPTQPRVLALMKLTALAGALVLSADRDVSDNEVKVLFRTLHHYFTDEPEELIVPNSEEIRRRLPDAIEAFRREAGEEDRSFLMSRLADIALADGALMDSEGAMILEIAQMLDIAPRVAYGIMVGAAQQVGFGVDVKLNRIAEELRRSLQVGLGPAR